MEKGEVTTHGTYLGETLVDRDPRLTIEQLADLPQVYSDQAPRKDVMDATGEPTGETEPDLSVFMDKAIAHVFEQQADAVDVPAQEVNGVMIPGYTFTPEPTQVTILVEDY